MNDNTAREMICIACPIGCRLTVKRVGNGAVDTGEGEISVTGNKCARGTVYGEEEYRAPKRMVTCTCPTGSDQFPRLPVRTAAAIPKELIDDLLKELYRTTVPLPVKRGLPVLKDYRGTGVDVVATMSMADR